MSFARAASCKSVLARRFQCTLQPMRAMAIDHHRSHWVLRQWATHGAPLPLQAHLYFIAPSPHPLYAARNLSSSTWPRSFLFAAGACLGGAMAQQGTGEDPSLVATSLLCRQASTADRGEHGRTDLHLHLSNAAAQLQAYSSQICWCVVGSWSALCSACLACSALVNVTDAMGRGAGNDIQIQFFYFDLYRARAALSFLGHI